MSITWIRAYKAIAEATKLAGYKPGMLTIHHPLYGHYVEYIHNNAKAGKLTAEQRAELEKVNFPVPAADVKPITITKEENLDRLANLLRKNTALTQIQVQTAYPELWETFTKLDNARETLSDRVLDTLLEINDTFYEREETPAEHIPAK